MTARAAAAARARAGAHRASWSWPATSSSSGTSSTTHAGGGILVAGARLGGQLGGLLRARHHRRRSGAAWSCCSSASCRRSGRAATCRPADIDLDLPSGDRREEVIQYVYKKYGAARRRHDRQRDHLSPALAVRDVGKALGLLRASELDRARQAHRPATSSSPPTSTLAEHLATARPVARPTDAPASCSRLTGELLNLPRHLGQHSGGMVICAGRLDEVVPLEPAAMPGRVVVQWDKDDCADLGIVKVDLLGLGMMAVLADAVPADRSATRASTSTTRTCRPTIRKTTRCCAPPTPSASSRSSRARRWRRCRA